MKDPQTQSDLLSGFSHLANVASRGWIPYANRYRRRTARLRKRLQSRCHLLEPHNGFRKLPKRNCN